MSDPPRPLEPEDWTRELLAAGWPERRLHVWADPSGQLYRGPFGAWRRMKARQRNRAWGYSVEVPDGVDMERIVKQMNKELPRAEGDAGA